MIILNDCAEGYGGERETEESSRKERLRRGSGEGRRRLFVVRRGVFRKFWL